MSSSSTRLPARQTDRLKELPLDIYPYIAIYSIYMAWIRSEHTLGCSEKGGGLFLSFAALCIRSPSLGTRWQGRHQGSCCRIRRTSGSSSGTFAARSRIRSSGHWSTAQAAVSYNLPFPGRCRALAARRWRGGCWRL